MAEQLVQITDLSKTPLIWVQPNKYAPDDIVVVFPNSADFPAGTNGTIPNGTAIRIVNFTDQDEKFTLRRSGTDTIQDFSTGDYLTDSVIREEFYRAEYVLDNGEWKIGMLFFPQQLTPRQSTGPDETLIQNDLYIYDGATQTRITLPYSATSVASARVGLHEQGGSNSNVQLSAQGADTFEIPEALGTFSSAGGSHNLHWPSSYFEWAREGTVWKLAEKMPRDPRIGQGTFTPLSNVGQTYITTLTYTVGQHGKQNLYVNLEFEWAPTGGNQDKDINARWTINSVEREARRFYDLNKAEAGNNTFTFSPWTEDLVPGDVINIDIRKNNADGTLDTTNGIIQLMGPFI